MLKFLDKYEKYLVYTLYFVIGASYIFLFINDDFKDGIWINIFTYLIFVPFIIHFLGKYVFGGLIILFLRFIAHLVEHKNLNLYTEDVANRDTTQLTFHVTSLILGLILCTICIILLTYIFEFLFQDYGIHFIDKLEDYWYLLLFGYLIFLVLIFWLAYLVHLNFFALLISLVGLVILLPNLFRYNVNQIESIEKLIVTVKIFFGLLFLILPWLFDRSYRRLE
jgi:hypothetical protein